MFKEIEAEPWVEGLDNFIRMEALPLDDALSLGLKKHQDFYVVGKNIQGYLDTLSVYGFKSFWDVQDAGPKQYLKRLLEHLGQNYDSANRSSLYAYIDYVLQDINANIMIFLPEKLNLVELTIAGNGRATGEEITRTLFHFPEKYNQIYFSTGLYEFTPTQFSWYVEEALK